MKRVPSEIWVAAIMELIQSGFKIEATIASFLETYADHPAIKNSGNPERLVRNGLTIGGNGINAELNLLNFAEAFNQVMVKKGAQFDAEARAKAKVEADKHERLVQEHDRLLARLRGTEDNLLAMTERAHTAELRYLPEAS